MRVDKRTNSCNACFVPTPTEVKETPLTALLVRCHVCAGLVTFEDAAMDYETSLFTCQFCEPSLS